MRQKIAAIGLRLLEAKEKKLIKFLGRKIYVCPHVFDPRYIFTTKFFGKTLRFKSKKVLEIGTGTGILSIIAAEKAKEVLAVDINPFAVKCAEDNVKLNKLKNIKVILSDLFSKVKGKFDLIIFNPPYLRGKPDRLIESAYYDNGILIRFFEQAKKYLNKEGKILLLYSSIANKQRLEKFIKEKEYNFKIIAKKHGLFENFFIYEIFK